MSAHPPGGHRCGGHSPPRDELREIAELFAERLARLAGDEDRSDAGSCTWCPVCALLAVVRGERPELAARMAEHAAGLLLTVTELLAGADRAAATRQGPHGADPAGDTTPDGDAARAGDESPRVQRIEVSRPGGGPDLAR